MNDDTSAAYDPRPVISVDRIAATGTSASTPSPRPSDYREVQPAFQRTTTQNQRLRPGVQNAFFHLREMPPFAREREIKTGRYSHFSAKERAFLLNAKY
jgi:hypothetical protein